MKRASTTREVLSITVCTALSVASLVLGSYDSLWAKLGTQDPTVRGYLTLGLSILFLLIGFLYAAHQRTVNISEALVDLRSALPHAWSLEVVGADAALNYLAMRLPEARTALNTRIVFVLPGTYTSRAGKRYAKALSASIKRGLVFKDLVNEPWLDHASRQVTHGANGGRYEYAYLELEAPSFLNFIVLEYDDDTEEVLFGWAISPDRGYEQRCFRSTERRLIAFFRDWHTDLYRYGAKNHSRQATSSTQASAPPTTT